MKDLSTNLNSKDNITFYSTNINETMKTSSELISTSTKYINRETHFTETNSELTSEIYDSSINKKESSNIFKTDIDSWTETNKLTTNSTENIKVSSEITSNSNLNDSYDSSEIFNSESNINTYNNSEINSVFSANIKYEESINIIYHIQLIQKIILLILLKKFQFR